MCRLTDLNRIYQPQIPDKTATIIYVFSFKKKHLQRKINRSVPDFFTSVLILLFRQQFVLSLPAGPNALYSHSVLSVFPDQ